MKFIKLLSICACAFAMSPIVSCSTEQAPRASRAQKVVESNQAICRIIPRGGATIDDAVEALTVRLGKMGVAEPTVAIVDGTDDVVTFALPDGCDVNLMMHTVGRQGHTVVYRVLTAGEAGVAGNPDRIAIDTVYSVDDKKTASAAFGFGGGVKPVWSIRQKIRMVENPDSIVDGYILYALQGVNAFDYAVKKATAKGVDGHVQVWVVYDSEGMRALPDYTERNVGHHVAVVVDDEVVSVPYLNGKITEGRLGVKGDYTTRQYHQLSAWMTPVKAQFGLEPVE